MSDPRPDLFEIEEAIAALQRVPRRALSARYAEMWLMEAASARNSSDLRDRLDKAEQQLGLALLASAAPSLELSLAYSLTQRARSEATD